MHYWDICLATSIFPDLCVPRPFGTHCPPLQQQQQQQQQWAGIAAGAYPLPALVKIGEPKKLFLTLCPIALKVNGIDAIMATPLQRRLHIL
jgi:hypothetical protein